MHKTHISFHVQGVDSLVRFRCPGGLGASEKAALESKKLMLGLMVIFPWRDWDLMGYPKINSDIMWDTPKTLKKKMTILGYPHDF